MNTHKIFLNPTMLEAGHPNLTMLEAAACGLSIIADWEENVFFNGAWRAPRDVFKMIDNRPLSPHLSIHKKVLTALFSIFHRITGIGLSLGSILIIIWFMLISLGPNYFIYFEIISKNILFKLILLIWTIGIFYHLYNGFRKLYWSFGFF